MKRLCAIFILIFLLCGGLVGFSSCQNNEKEIIESIDQLKEPGRIIGICPGSASADVAQNSFPDAKYMYFNSEADALLSLQEKMIDAFVYDSGYLEFAMKNGASKNVKLLDGFLGEYYNISVGISRKTKIPGLRDKLNTFIANIKKDGTYDRLEKYWVTDLNTEMPVHEKPENTAGTLFVATSGTSVPYSFMSGTQLSGMDIELATMFAYSIGYDVRFDTYNFDGLIAAAAAAGNADCIFSDLQETEERRQEIGFSDPLRVCGTRVAVYGRKGSSPAVTFDSLNNEGVKIGIVTGTVFDALITTNFPKAETVYANNYTDLAQMTISGKVNGFITDEPMARYMSLEEPELSYFSRSLLDNNLSYVMEKSAHGSDIQSKLNEFVFELRASGELEKIDSIWFEGNDDDAVVDIPESGENGILKIALEAISVPFTYVKDGEFVGYDIDILARFCKKYGYGMEIKNMDFSAIISAVTTGDCDIGCSGITITEERAESVLFCEPVYIGGTVVVVKSDFEEEKGFFESIAESFNKTFVKEERWKLILDGILTTVYISVFSILIGTVLAFGICMLGRSKNIVAKGFYRVYVALLEGTPLVVLLMILYYLVFSKSGLAGEWVAIITFAINFSAYVGQIFKTGIESVGIGQTEAALTLGYTKPQAFLRIVLPQAATHILPIYRGECISLVKMTSIVGYIAVQDLTKMGDIIRSRTYEAFFPLIATAVIYFLISYLLVLLLRYLEKKIAPNKKNRGVKGVKMQ